MAIVKTTLAKDDENGNVIFVYPKSTADIIEYDDNTSVKEKLDEIESSFITIDKLPEAIVKSNTASVSIGAVNAMLKVAESYFNHCYTPSGQEPGITYKGHTGLYSANTQSNGVDAINCSQFINALLTGVSYENSRYVNDKNIGYNWGIRFDDSNPELFGSTSQDDTIEVNNRYLTSQNLAKYAYEHGYLHMIKDNDSCDFKIRPGDIIFSTSGLENTDGRFLNIDHVAFVINVGNEILDYNKSSNASNKPIYSRIESYADVSKIDLDGTSHDTAGLRLYNENNITSARGNVCVARFPIGDVSYQPEVVESISNINLESMSNSLIYQTETEVDQGFYTIVLHGNTSSNPYVSSLYNGASGSTYHRPMLHVNDNNYYITIYQQYAGKIQVRMAANSGSYCNIEEITVYKGYADTSIHTKIEENIYGIDNLSDALKTNNITLTNSTVNAMLDVAESYFNYAYLNYQMSGSDEVYNGFVYDNNKGLYKTEVAYDDAFPNRYAISNAQFIEAVLNGIALKNSRYKNNKNTQYDWGITFDNTVIIGSSNPDESEISNKFVTVQNLARYAYEHGYLYKIDKSTKVRPGDILFSGNSANNFLGINYANIVINTDGEYCATLSVDNAGTPSELNPDFESYKSDENGNPVDSYIPFRLINGYGQSVNKPKINNFTYGATFPLGDAGSSSNLIDYIEKTSGSTREKQNEEDEYATLIKSFDKIVDRGFYTIVAHGTFQSTPYISIKYCNSGKSDYQAPMYKIGKNDYYLTVYSQYSPSKVYVRMLAGNYSIDEILLYKGYADPTSTKPQIYSSYENDGSNFKELIPNTNIDDCMIGVWYCSEQNKNNITTGLSKKGAFRLESVRMSNTDEIYKQTLWFLNDDDTMYTRTYYNSSWNAWYKFVGELA